MESGATASQTHPTRPVSYSTDRNRRQENKYFAASIAGGIIVDGSIFVCAIPHTPICTNSLRLCARGPNWGWTEQFRTAQAGRSVFQQDRVSQRQSRRALHPSGS